MPAFISNTDLHHRDNINQERKEEGGMAADLLDDVSECRRGIKKAMIRLPTVLKQKTGLADETTDPEYKVLDAEFDATEAANKELLTAFTCTSRAIRVFLQKLQALQPATDKVNEHVLDELLLTLKTVVDDMAVPRLNELVDVYKRVYGRMIKRRHKLMDYDKARLAVGKAKQHHVAKAQSQFEAVTLEYNRHNDALKRDMPKLFSLRKQVLSALVQQYENFMRRFFQSIPALLGNGQASKSYADMQAEHARAEELMRELLDGLVLLPMTARRTESVVDQLTGKLKGTLKLGEQNIVDVRNKSRPSNAYYRRSAQELDAHDQEDVEPEKTPTMAAERPTAQPNALRVISPPEMTNKAAMVAPKNGEPRKGGNATAVALYDFEGTELTDLPFRAGDRLIVTKRSDSQDDWWTGTLYGTEREGIFPANYVRLI